MFKELSFGGRVGAGGRRAVGALALVGAIAAAGCGDLTSDAETQEGATTSPTPVASDDILGFEKTPGWTWASTGQRLSERRTQGIQSFALDLPAYETRLTSQKVSSTAKGLANLADAGSQLAIDIMLPEFFKTPTATSFIQLKVKSSARGLAQTDLGKIKLNGLPGGVFQTVKWAIPASVRSKLGGATYSDLIFDLYIRPFDCPSDPIRIDNLRVRSPTRAPAGAGVSIDLVAQRTYGPEVSLPAEARFAAGPVQIPQSFHVKLGKSGPVANTTKLELGYNTTIAYSCTYAAGNVGGAGKSYDFKSCTGGGKPGDIVSADFARLTILKGDAAAGTTKIRAQLAGKPLGDDTGRALIPAMPTFWGDAPAEIDGIIDTYSAALNGPAKTEQRFVKMPVPEFALRHGDGSARDLLDPNLPPPPNDPPFSQEGHMNPGSGTWDAWWALNGLLEYGDTDQRHTSHLHTELSANILVWGFVQPIAQMILDVKTDNGRVTSTGYEQPSSTGSLHFYLFGAEIPGGGERTIQTGFGYNFTDTKTINAPTIRVWIFSITVGVNARATLTAVGDLRLDGFHVNVTPSMSVGAHLTGAIDLGIAAGGLDVSVDFLQVATPVDASATWNLSLVPGNCQASMKFDLTGNLVLSALGGSVDLVARFGVCPFCYEDSWNIFKWAPVNLGTKELFSFHETLAGFPISADTCKQPLLVAASAPSPVYVGVPVTLSGMAKRKSGPVQPGQPAVDTDVPCQYLTWHTTDPAVSPSTATGCSAQFTFNTPGVHVVDLTATNQFGETATVSDIVDVTAAPSGPIPVIVSPLAGTFFWGQDHVTLQASVVNGTGPFTYTWSYIDVGGVEHAIGDGPTRDFVSPADDYHLKLVVTDSTMASNATQIKIEADQKPK